MANGHAFFQNAYARDLRIEGAMLSGIEHPLQAEDVIGVQYGDKKARFRVVRVRDAGLPQRIQADVELLSGQECPWKDLVKHDPEQSAANAGAAASSNKRTFPRLKVQFPIELRDERGVGAPMQTPTADVSGRGCYVESRVPLPLGTKLNLVFWVESEKITTAGLVRASDPGVGMGIEFVGLDDVARERLQTFLEKLVAESGSATATS
jgi:hypothetical protein